MKPAPRTYLEMSAALLKDSAVSLFNFSVALGLYALHWRYVAFDPAAARSWSAAFEEVKHRFTPAPFASHKELVDEIDAVWGQHVATLGPLPLPGSCDELGARAEQVGRLLGVAGALAELGLPARLAVRHSLLVIVAAAVVEHGGQKPDECPVTNGREFAAPDVTAAAFDAARLIAGALSGGEDDYRYDPAEDEYSPRGPDGQGRNRLRVDALSPSARCMAQPTSFQAAWEVFHRPAHVRASWGFFRPCTHERCATCPVAARARGPRRRLMSDASVIREDEQGRVWLLSRRDGGWAEFGLPYDSWADLLLDWELVVERWSSDEHGRYYTVSKAQAAAAA